MTLRLDGRRRAALVALCGRIAPLSGEPARAGALASAVEARAATASPATSLRLSAALRLLDSRVAVAACIGRTITFSTLAPPQQDRVLLAWERSRIPVRRALFQALRRLILSTYYGQQDALERIGWPGPLNRRGVRFDWEGVLPGSPHESEPVARGDRATPLAASAPSTGAPPRGVVRGDTFAAGAVVRAGICVIGSGAGGAVAAARLAEAGHEVVVLEEGGWWDATDFSESEGEMVPRLYADAGLRATEDFSVTVLQGRCAGGSSTINWLVMLRAPDRVLDEWRTVHGTEEMGPEEMRPVFELIERETHTFPVPDDAHSPNNRIILDGSKALGWSARPAMINTEGCVRAGSCGLGCRWGAKRGAQSVYLHRALAAGARLLCEVRADRIELAERGGRAPLKRIHCTALGRGGRTLRGRITVESPIVLIACGAVEAPALLQRSALGTRAVGRNLRLHPTSAVVGAFDHDVYGGAGIPLSVVCDEFLHRDPHGHGFWIEAPPLSPALAAAALPGFGRPHARMMADYPRLGATMVLVRDGSARTAGGSVRVAGDGLPRIHYRLSVPDRRHLLDGLAAAARIVMAAGAREAWTLHTPPFIVRKREDVMRIPERASRPNQLSVFSAHVMGTCRLGADPRRSACGPTGELHDVPGVYVADGSLMPSAPGVNPQETIMALATVISRGIIARHAPQ